MDALMGLTVGIALLLVTLSIAMKFLSTPISIARRTGVLRAARHLLVSVARGLRGILAFLLGVRRRRRIRTPLRRTAMKTFRH